MKKILLPIVCCSLLLSSTTSCGLAQWAVLSDPDASETSKGAVIGAASGAHAGAFVGSLFGDTYRSSRNNSFLGAAVGAVAGAALGAAIGNDRDKKAEQRASEEAVYYSDAPRQSSGVRHGGQGGGVRYGSQPSGDCIYYGQTKTKLSGTAKQSLDHVANRLLNDPTAVAEVYGYTDNSGAYNERCRLSVERAQVVKAYLIKKGVPANQIFCKGMADQRPVGDNATADGRALNRRVEILITHNVDDDFCDQPAAPAQRATTPAPSTQHHDANTAGETAVQSSNMIE